MDQNWTFIDWDKVNKRAIISNGSSCCRLHVPDEYLLDRIKFNQYLLDYCILLEEELKEGRQFDPSHLVGQIVGDS